MDSFGLAEAFRSDVVDVVEPHLWSDTDVFGYMDEAIKMFWRLVGGIADTTTPEVCEIDVVAGEKFSPVHSSVLTVRYAQLDSNGRELDLLNLSAGKVVLSGDDYGRQYIRVLDDTPGPVRAMIIGMEKNKVRWIKVPTADDIVRITVYRLPLTEIVLGDEPQELEVESIHHRSLLHWMEHLAYSKPDAETFDRTKAADKEARFRAYCAATKLEWDRYRHVPREMEYGGL